MFCVYYGNQLIYRINELFLLREFTVSLFEHKYDVKQMTTLAMNFD